MKKENNNKKETVKNLVIIGMALAITILILTLALMPKSNATNVYVTDPQPITNEIHSSHQDGQVDLPMLTDFTVNEENQWINLKNPSSNVGIYEVQYIFTLDGESEPLFTSDRVQSGYQYAVNIYELMSKYGTGDFKCNVLVQPFKVETGEPCNNLNSLITITRN